MAKIKSGRLLLPKTFETNAELKGSEMRLEPFLVG
jgi:hypothetical protein